MRYNNIYILLFCLITLVSCNQGNSHNAPETYSNPIIKGGNPDPSIIRVDDTYYLVTSSFIFYPGVPVYKSKDLVNWELIGYALHTPEHIDINDRTGTRGGVWAPTIRYHNGLFYVTVTQRSCGESIVTTASNPAGPWSTPVELHSQNGIDGSLLFDDDGKVWYTWSEDGEILLRGFDKDSLKLVGEKTLLLDQKMFGDDYEHIEGPHIYKLESGEYLLLIAAGGTGRNNHNVSVFKSDKPTGPYTPHPNNPILTHLGSDSPFQNMGHADIVQTQNGEWWAVMLGVRPQEGFTIMERETFLAKFEWHDGWPVFEKHEGGRMVLEKAKRPDLPWTPVPEIPANDNFENAELGLQYNFYHTPKTKWWSLTDNPGHLRIYLQKPQLTEQTNTPFVGRRITEFNFNVSTVVKFKANSNETAGLVAMTHQDGMMRIEIFQHEGVNHVRAVMYEKGRKTPFREIVTDSIKIDSQTIQLALEARGLDYQFYAGPLGGELVKIGDPLDGKSITRQVVGSYSGTYIGVFASSNGIESSNYADFDNFSYATTL
jgi:xylan 1,4-beta-xylosidase